MLFLADNGNEERGDGQEGVKKKKRVRGAVKPVLDARQISVNVTGCPAILVFPIYFTQS